jgi:peroxiredoxin
MSSSDEKRKQIMDNRATAGLEAVLKPIVAVLAGIVIALGGCNKRDNPAGLTAGQNSPATQSADEDEPALKLVGKNVPDFTLTRLEGGTVSRSDLAGKVYVLDFWATWCPPCRKSLPHLAELYDSEKGSGLLVYAVNAQEEKPTVQEFVDKTKLDVPVLLDTDGKPGEAFMTSAIPETVVVGKTGIVEKVFIGFNPDKSPQELKAAVHAAMKK